MLLKEKNEIIDWLDKYKVENYTLRPDEKYGYIVDVVGDVNLINKKLKEIRVKFGTVTGSFFCKHNQLLSLKGSPGYIGGGFSCHDNALSSLEFAPHSVKGAFICSDNQLTSLHGSPQHVGGYFDCSDNQLNSLDGMSKIIDGRFYCRGNQELGDLQDITDFEMIKTYLLSEKLANELNIKDNKRKVKL